MLICPICKNSDKELIKNSFLPKFRYCTACGGHFLVGGEPASYPEEYFSETSEPSSVAKAATPILNFFYKLRINKIKKILKNKSNPKVLDYGCGAGKLVQMLGEEKIMATGFEPSEGARQIAARKNLPVYDEVKTVEGGYDLIMFWHSLEHADNPLEVVEKTKEYLNRDGKLLIAVPNAASFEAKFFKDKWFHYAYPFHRVQFTSESAAIMLNKSGFKILETDYFNPEYTISGIIQSFLNVFLPKDTLYSVISHRRQTPHLSKAILISFVSIFLILIFSPILILFFIFQLILGKTGAMVIIAEKL